MYHRIIAVCLVLLLAAALFAGCTDKPSQNETKAPSADATETKAPVTKAPQTDAPETKASETQAPETSAAESKLSSDEAKALAEGLIGKPVEELYAAIGKPNDASYASSCDGPGDDGELYYEGFTVYTYREGEQETVKDVY